MYKGYFIIERQIFKFTSVSTAVKILKSHSLYFNSPFAFNDVFEGYYRIEKAIRIRQENVPISWPEIEPALLEANCDLSVSCFSERRDSLLMWAHYGGSYSGVCIRFGFEPRNFFSNKSGGYSFGPVTYSSRLPLVRFHEEFLDWTHIKHQVKDALFTKAVEWQYEREFRILLNEPLGLKAFSPDALLQITVGPRAPEEEVEQLSNAIMEYNQIFQTQVDLNFAVVDGVEYQIRFTDVPKAQYQELLAFPVIGIDPVDVQPTLTLSPENQVIQERVNAEVQAIANNSENRSGETSEN